MARKKKRKIIQFNRRTYEQGERGAEGTLENLTLVTILKRQKAGERSKPERRSRDSVVVGRVRWWSRVAELNIYKKIEWGPPFLVCRRGSS